MHMSRSPTTSPYTCKRPLGLESILPLMTDAFCVSPHIGCLPGKLTAQRVVYQAVMTCGCAASDGKNQLCECTVRLCLPIGESGFRTSFDLARARGLSVVSPVLAVSSLPPTSSGAGTLVPLSHLTGVL